MDYEIQSIIPNTTQIPHLIIRVWMPLLSDVELRILLVVADQTLGWIEDMETKRRKEKDWISQGQLMKKINRSDRSIQNSLKRLVDELRIIQAHDELGELLDSSQKRMKCGGKIFYRLSLKHPQQIPDLTTPEKSSRVRKFAQPPKNLRAKKFRATKETEFTKKSYRTRKLVGDNKKIIPTRYFIGKFSQLCQAIRHTKPTLVKFKDGNLLKHALSHLTEFQLELEFIWFLQNKPSMSPSIGAALCKEVLRDFIKASYREYGFYGNLEQIAMKYGTAKNSKTENEAEKMSAMVEALNKLKESLSVSRK
ncbi:MAG: hypothetical protein WC848_04795 [Parcubacteria group bacterium]|jgi:hypothetical protein